MTPNDKMIKISDELNIPDDELTFTASKSSGPGGQYVNKVNTRITLWFDVTGSPSLSDDQKNRIQTHLSTRISKTGILRVIAQSSRSQIANKELAIQRCIELLREALQQNPLRKKTKIPAKVRQQRIDAKKHRSRFKKLRFKIVSPEE
jgi:ribosome-associated protein